MKTKRLLMTLVVCASITASAAAQGLRLAGPAASDAPALCDTRTKIRSLPFTITKPGSYVVVRDVFETTGSGGLKIEASDVTIDLGGHVLDGGDVTSGIVATAPLENVAVRNGTLRDWSSVGIDLDTVTGVLLEDVTVIGSSFAAVRTGPGAVILRCCFENNRTGASLGDDTVLHRVTAIGNLDYGLVLDEGAVVSQGQLRSNGTSGALGASSAVFQGCNASSNQDHAYQTFGAAVLSDCMASDNLGNGFHVSSPSVMAGCSSRNNDGYGVWAVGSPMTPRVLVDNRVNGNGLDGIYSTHGGLVRGNTITENLGDGIQLVGENFVTDNLVHGNVGDGIRATSGSNRIDRNNVTRNARGVVVTNPLSIVIRNKATLNVTTNYDVVMGAWLGTVATSVLTATPWSNFSF